MSKKLKLIYVVALCAVLIMTMAFVGCKTTTATAAAETTAAAAEKTTAAAAETTAAAAVGTQGGKVFQGAPDELYSMVVMVSGVEYWFPVYEMFKQAGRQLGVKTHYDGCPEYDIQKEIAVFEQVVAQNPKGILVHPMNSDAFIAPINAAMEKGIAVCTFAADSPKSNRLGYITSDNVMEGYSAADSIAEAMGGKGKVAVLENPGQDNHDLRIKSFISRIETNWPDIKVVNRAASNQDPQKAYQATLAFLQKDPDLGGIFMPEASSAMGAAQAVVEKKSSAKVVCADVNAKVLDMIKAGEIFGAINPNQGMQGYFGMLMLFTAAHPELVDPMDGYKVEKRNPTFIPKIDNGLSFVTKDNADSFYWDAYVKGRNSKGVEE